MATKKDLIDHIVPRAGDTHAVVKAVVRQFFQEITRELAKGNRLEFRDFGVFEPKATPARMARNPGSRKRSVCQPSTEWCSSLAG